MRRQIVENRSPVIFAVYVNGGSDPDYDHIVTAVGWNDRPNNNHEIVFQTHFKKNPVTLPIRQFVSTRAQCQRSLIAGGCLPWHTCYGMAIHGLRGQPPDVSVRIELPARPNRLVSAQRTVWRQTTRNPVSDRPPGSSVRRWCAVPCGPLCFTRRYRTFVSEDLPTNIRTGRYRIERIVRQPQEQVSF